MEIEHRYPCKIEIRRRGGGGGGGRGGGGRGGGRSGGRSIRGKLGLSPGRLRRAATLRNRGKIRKELLNKKAFSWSIAKVVKMKEDLEKMLKSGATKEAVENTTQELARRDIHVLSGHEWSKPLGSVAAGTAIVSEYLDDPEDPYIGFEVPLPEDEETLPSYMQDTVKQIELGLIGGVSPGFLVPPPDVVPNAEELIPEPGNEEVLIRVINQAVLKELSLVVNPVFTENEITVRDMQEEEESNEEQGDRDRPNDLERFYIWL